MNYRFRQVNQRLSDLENGVTGPKGINSLSVGPENFTFDLSQIGVDAGSMFGIIECVDYNPSVDGAIWFKTKYPDVWDTTSNISIEFEHNLNGLDTGKNVLINVSLWAINSEDTPDENSPDVILSQVIVSDATNTGKLNTTTLSNTLLESFITPTTQLIVGKVSRAASDAGDTYGGTFQLSEIQLTRV